MQDLLTKLENTMKNMKEQLQIKNEEIRKKERDFKKHRDALIKHRSEYKEALIPKINEHEKNLRNS